MNLATVPAYQPMPLWAGRFEAPQWRKLGLGFLGACPAGLYDNVTNPGFCTNVPPDQQGRPLDVVSVAAPPSVIAPPVNAAIVTANEGARFGLQLTPDRGTQEQLVAEVIAQAGRRGLPASCHIDTNYAPAMPPLPGYVGYAGYCSVGGGGEDSAAQLLLPGHLDVYAINNPGAIPAAPVPISAGSGPATTSTGNSTPGGAPLPASSANWPAASAPAPAVPGAPGAGLLDNALSIFDGLSAQTGLPSWGLLAAAGVAAFFVLGGKR